MKLHPCSQRRLSTERDLFVFIFLGNHGFLAIKVNVTVEILITSCFCINLRFYSFFNSKILTNVIFSEAQHGHILLVVELSVLLFEAIIFAFLFQFETLLAARYCLEFLGIHYQANERALPFLDTHSKLFLVFSFAKYFFSLLVES